ncbi:ROK family protein [Sphingomonas soli]|uniref:ROK family protein n=1 Tax=Sphingomonas soli TaxID=266127 RepID=UPI000A006685|nr:ROK family protein [Sphingomonas soli]
MATSPLIAGLELGGTKCVAILGTGPGDIRKRVTVPTTDPATTLAGLEAALDGWEFDALGIASFGPLELDPGAPDFGSITATTKPGWTGTDLTKRLAARYSRPLAIQTDVVGAALAEARWGAAQGLGTHAYITIGTGVGVGLINGGKPVQGVAHGEAGHMRVARAPGDGFAGWCPFHGDCVEGLIAGPALAQRFGCPGQELPEEGPQWDLFVHDLTGLLHNLVVTAAPQRIAIGGGVIAAREHLFDRLRASLAKSIGGYGSLSAYAGELDRRLGPPGLGTLAGPMGAIAMGLEALDA